MIPLIILLLVFAFNAEPAQRRGPKPKPTPSPTPLATPTPTPIATPTPTASPTNDLFRVDEFGQVTATNFDTWSTNGSYRIAGRTVLRYDDTFTNLACGKVSNTLAFPGQQNFMCGNVVAMPSGIGNTSFGWDTGRPTSGDGNTFFGHDAGLGINTGSYNVFIGMHSGPPDQAGSVQVTGSIGIGVGARVTADNQFLLGGVIPIKDAYIGSGVTSASPSPVTIQTTGGSGTNNPGAALTLAGGRSTGSATPASIYFSTSTRTVSGATQQSPVRRWEIDGEGDLKSLNGGKVKANPQLIDGVKPACTESTRGQIWQTFGSTGQGDFVEICMKTASGLYAYRIWLFPQ